MTIHEQTLALAQSISGAADSETSLLALLCIAAEQTWQERLREDVDPSDCADALACAAAFSAAAGLLGARTDGGGVSSFTAGSVSVSASKPAETSAAASALREEAERLMAPYAVSGGFALRGVRT